MLEHEIDPDTSPQQADLEDECERTLAALDTIAKAAEKLSGHGCSIDFDGDDDDVSLSICFHGLTMDGLLPQVCQRLFHLLTAMANWSMGKDQPAKDELKAGQA